MNYLQGHVKRNPETGEVVIRTVFPEDVPEMMNLAWLGASITSGARNYRTDEIESWEDLYVPSPVSDPDAPS